MISQELIDKGGSKLEITRALLEEGYGSPESGISIPRSIWKYCGQSLDSILPEFQKMKKPVIVRGSHMNDYHGFIDVVPTKRNIESFSELEKFVKDSESFMRTEDIKIHCEDWEQPYTEEIHFLIQEQGSDIVGNMIRHPHSKKLIMQYVDLENYMDDSRLNIRNPVSYIRINVDGSEFFHISHIYPEITDDEIKELIEMYEKLENSGIVDASFSQQMEFGLRPLMFYQAKPFKQFEESKDFEIPYKLDCPNISSMDVFGITSKEGIELPFITVCGSDLVLNDWKNFGEDGKNYGMILNKKISNQIPLKKRFGNLTVFCSKKNNLHFLFHHVYRFMKKADFSFTTFFVENIEKSSIFEYGKKDFEDFKESRFFCNGEDGVIIPAKYL